MKNRDRGYAILMIIFAFVMQGCIHDYPHPVRGPFPGKGEDPTTVGAIINVSFNLSWESMLHHVNFYSGTRARTDKPYRFVIEVVKEGVVVSHDVINVSSEEFSLGKLKHKLSKPLEASLYKITAWYDIQDNQGEYSFLTEELGGVTLINHSTTDAEILQCGYASDIIDLTPYAEDLMEETVSKELEMQHPGARFEIVATDVQQFITNQKAALNQGDQFTVHISFGSEVGDSFNLYAQSLNHNGETLNLSGRMRLPFAEYDELKIAEGFIFSDAEQDVEASLSVKNSALVTVAGTGNFTFPVKRGYITTVKGDFLTNGIGGMFNIDHIWEGEIVIEI